MDDAQFHGGDPITGPAASVDEAHLRRLGAVLWTLAFLSVTAVILFSDGRLAALDWRDAAFIALRTFAGVIAFFVVFPVILAALSAVRLR
ncbi:hypothetical protein [Halorubrum lacusprofundi]|jgi:hypothetical protein|uniref:Uncharacterized protein n=1 Tax=Halorubrum lacusprofundi (strain ATCC 49239 / DSM 5036 / JCM 8891 / ACAM 34) TaxID=416348 RepID=B9LRT4_HALLT|nr:hypothetical protein [Halorubrum lacusprofundi]ACM57808.1 hypothetical protein Hlac_2231 [Halorubrum lacusprofundi ATCC 49239]MCG1007037.1 hypothetical protein [Halorubrum lacusprofundi]